MVPTLPEDSIIVSLPFGGAVLRSLGCTAEEVNVLLEDTRKKFVMEKGEWVGLADGWLRCRCHEDISRSLQTMRDIV